MNKAVSLILVAVLCAALGISAGCGKKTVPPPSSSLSAEEQAKLKAEEERRMREASLREQEARQGEAKMREVFVNQDIYYEYDRYDLTSEAKQVLNDKAAYMQSHPELNVIVEGHCDERGSNAYNLALGEKRAYAAKAYLEAMGIDPARIEVVSYGEERPLVLGQTEEAYAANRRAHFVIK